MAGRVKTFKLLDHYGDGHSARRLVDKMAKVLRAKNEVILDCGHTKEHRQEFWYGFLAQQTLYPELDMMNNVKMQNQEGLFK
jgi:hypothetical protein